jgi:hypothetical protein
MLASLATSFRLTKVDQVGLAVVQKRHVRRTAQVSDIWTLFKPNNNMSFGSSDGSFGQAMVPLLLGPMVPTRSAVTRGVKHVQLAFGSALSRRSITACSIPSLRISLSYGRSSWMSVSWIAGLCRYAEKA